MIRAQKPQMFRSALSSSLIWAFNPKFPSKFNHLFFADNYSDQAPRYIKVDVAVDVDVDEVLEVDVADHQQGGSLQPSQLHTQPSGPGQCNNLQHR